jgi:HNH endonuclease
MEEIDRISRRFWGKVDFNGFPRRDSCWLWTAGLHKHGLPYGKFKLNGKTVAAHRVAWELANGEPPNLLVLHRCDVPRCVRPSHLFIGTHADNKQDCVNKQRHAAGERNGRAKLSRADVEAIRKQLSYRAQCEIALSFGVSHQLISRIKLGGVWRKRMEGR